jgi:16S rRNA (adenine1518-N6/adenine1519-N6)-dimethyltransferase
VVANLPYNVATPLLLRLLDHPATFSSMVLMFQREVGDRILAGPADPARGSLSVQVQARAHVRPVLQLPPGAFHPPPKVHSVVLGFALEPAPDFGGVPARVFDRVVRAGFQHRRKTLENSLGASFPRDAARRACEQVGVDPRRRAETLTLAEWRLLAGALYAAQSAGAASVPEAPIEDEG